MASDKSGCSLSRYERAVLGGSKILIRLAVMIAAWRARSAIRVVQHAGGVALWMIGVAATGLGVILHTSLRPARLRGTVSARVFEREAVDPDSFGAEVVAWASPRAVNGGRMVP